MTIGPMTEYRLRRILATLMAAGAAISLAASAMAGPNPRAEYQTTAPNAILIEADSGTVLFEKSADDLLHPRAWPS